MADDVNKPRGSRVSGDLSSFENIMRKFERAAKPGVLETRLQKVTEQIEAKMADITNQIGSGVVDLEEGLKQLSQAGAANKTIGHRLTQEQAARTTRTRRTFEESVGQFAGDRTSASRVRGYGEDPSVFTEAASQSNQKSFTQLQREQIEAANKAQRLRERMVELSQDPNASRRSFEQLASGVTHYERQEALASESMDLQRKQGRSIKQRYERGDKLVEEIETRDRRQKRLESVTEAGNVKPFTLGNQLESASKEFVNALSAWKKAVESGAKNVDELSSAAESAEKNLLDIKWVAQKVGHDNTKPPGLIDQVAEFFGGKIAAGAHIGAEAVRGAGQLTRFWGADFRIEKAMTQTNAAAFANRQYEDMISATRGRDVSAMRRLLGGYQAVDKASEEMRDYEKLYGIAAGGADFIQSLIKTGQKLGSFQFKEAAEAGRELVVNTAVHATRYGSGTAQEQKSMQGRQQLLEFFDTVSKVGNINMQALTDFGFEAGLATRGAGGRRNELMSGFEGGGLKDLAALGISPEDAIALTRQGVQNMGAAFTTQTLKQTGAAQQAGLLNADQFIQASAELTAIGGGANELEKVMARAVAAGMNNSKNIQQMVSATISLSQAAALTGQNVTAGTSELLALQMENLQDVDVNQRTAIAANAQRAADNLAGDRDYNLMTVFRSGMVRRDFADSDFATQQRLMTVRPNEVQSLSARFGNVEAGEAGAEDEFIGQVRRAGLGTAFLKYDKEGKIMGIRDDAKTRINTLVSHQRQIGVAATTKFGMMISDKETRESLASGRPSDRAEDIAGAVEATEGVTGRFKLFQNVGRTAKEGAINKTAGAAGDAERERERAAETAVKQINAAIETFAGKSGTLAAAMSKLNTNFDLIAESLKAKASEGKAMEAAETFRQPAIDINLASITFKDAVRHFAETVGAGAETKKLLQRAKDELKKQDTSNKRKSGG